MRRLNRYLFATVSASILMVLAVIIGFDAIADIIDEMGELEGNYTFLKALQYVAASIPANIFDFLPFAALVGCLAGLGSLASNSELVVLRSAGVSTTRIVWMVMRPALLILFVGMLISEYIAPLSESFAQSERAIALRKSDNLVSKEGVWHREGDSFMHFNVVQPKGVLYGITVYTFDGDKRLQSTLYAERAIFHSGGWELEDVVTSKVFDDRVDATSVSRRDWQTALTPALLETLMLEPEDLSISGLWHYVNYLKQQGLYGGAYELAFWKKVLQPVSAMALVLVAISFVFGPLREVTMGFRIFVGVLFGIVFRTIQDMLSPASMVYGFEPMYATLLPIVICALIGFWLLRRAR